MDKLVYSGRYMSLTDYSIEGDCSIKLHLLLLSDALRCLFSKIYVSIIGLQLGLSLIKI